MGVMIYWLIVAAVIAFGALLPQEGKNRKYYIVVMAALHIFVCGFRYMYLTGDLIKYASVYYDIGEHGWFSEDVLKGGRNFGFSWVMKLLSFLSNGNFQVLLFVIALLIESCAALLIYKHSPKPWLSYLVWNCMSFYIFGFSAIKQAMAMGLIMLSMDSILENRLDKFLIFTLLAGTIHVPALVFLPAYWIANRRVNVKILGFYVVIGALIFIFRNLIVALVSELYYDETDITFNYTSLGGSFFVIVLILLTGLILNGFHEGKSEKLFNIVVVAAIIQMYSGFDNVFTRLAYYYLQFVVLYIPMILFNQSGEESTKRSTAPVVVIDNQSRKMLAMCIVLVLIWWYYKTCLSVTISYEVDNYLNFRFMWDVVS